MGFRSAKEKTGEDRQASSIPSIQELVGGSNRSRGGGRSLTPQDCESRFGLDMYRDGLEVKVQRLVQSHGASQVRQWADEGMTVETMGKPRDMRQFRERQKERPAEVPKDIERRNAKSVQRSRNAHHEASKAGDTQVPNSVRDVVSSPGQQLDTSIQRAMEERMGDSLGDVRIHTGPRAAKACEDINARAFTVGNHIAFNHGEYDPSSAEGQHVLAHELAHVRQQTGGAVSMLPQLGGLEVDPDQRLEREAEETAQRVMRGGKLGIHRMRDADVHIQWTSRISERETGSDHSEAIELQRLPDDERLNVAVEGVEAAISWVTKQTELSQSSARVMVSEANGADELAMFQRNVAALHTTAAIDDLPEKRQRQVARNLLSKDPLDLDGNDTKATGEIPEGIRRDINAVFGYSPSESEEVPDFGVNWTDPDHVIPARETREEYVNNKKRLRQEAEELRKKSHTIEQVARKAVLERNVDRIMSYITEGDREKIQSIVERSDDRSANDLFESIQPHIQECDEQNLRTMLERNEKKYGKVTGPDADQLYQKYDRNWEVVIEKTTQTNSAVNILVGLEDI
ncbi:DUF4157 domain-containing protein [Haloferax sp. S1W]|uniref:eCIS core domain-containing protein n=1 Tax=Haloferax sp. S1W TaxID=3377110 RepID=UPI0037C9675C